MALNRADLFARPFGQGIGPKPDTVSPVIRTARQQCRPGTPGRGKEPGGRRTTPTLAGVAR